MSLSSLASLIALRKFLRKESIVLTERSLSDGRNTVPKPYVADRCTNSMSVEGKQWGFREHGRERPRTRRRCCCCCCSSSIGGTGCVTQSPVHRVPLGLADLCVSMPPKRAHRRFVSWDTGIDASAERYRARCRSASEQASGASGASVILQWGRIPAADARVASCVTHFPANCLFQQLRDSPTSAHRGSTVQYRNRLSRTFARSKCKRFSNFSRQPCDGTRRVPLMSEPSFFVSENLCCPMNVIFRSQTWLTL